MAGLSQRTKDIGVVRELEILDLLDMDFDEATAEELADAAGLPTFAVQRVLAGLHDAEVVARERRIRRNVVFYVYSLHPVRPDSDGSSGV